MEHSLKCQQLLSRIIFVSIGRNFVKFQETCGKVIGTAIIFLLVKLTADQIQVTFQYNGESRRRIRFGFDKQNDDRIRVDIPKKSEDNLQIER